MKDTLSNNGCVCGYLNHKNTRVDLSLYMCVFDSQTHRRGHGLWNDRQNREV